ncbi:helix-turn-helix domain-containing protein [Aquibacillus koreensis]|uniref:Helix-turn-helix domain-containing protein n=1 Tax=Aquibacillus koreensis TaxID=279446 RepID=A0A9X3WLH1_9BACI|nr:helix-turn-helix transcriptional regulator [Aquibacillus koreensis]MCT2534840.1 helix-turn-helix domain-containing protein [Aquibacillus koreensis]MDC3419549.1 helix-turn-helix domain-containing protein [Aquibacillus koreensis]
MIFGETLYKLRKEKGLSQEAMAEKLNTSRQAISKWENGQGFPETEKLLMISNMFEVSVDYLLKGTSKEQNKNERGHYVSKEMAEGFLMHVNKTTIPFALGISLLILSTIPYLVFKDRPEVYSFLIIIIATLGVLQIVTAVMRTDNSYAVLKQDPLLFDHHYLEALKQRYKEVKKKYTTVATIGIVLIAISFVGFLLESKDISHGVLVPYYPVLVVFIAIGVSLLIPIIMMIESYELLVKNEAHLERLNAKSNKKWKRKWKEWF